MEKRSNNLDFLARCSFCNNSLEENEVEMVEEKDNHSVFHTTCSRCRTSALVFLSSNQSGIASLGVVTDLEREEVVQMFSREAINADEVLDVHRLMSGYKGDIRNLLQ